MQPSMRDPTGDGTILFQREAARADGTRFLIEVVQQAADPLPPRDADRMAMQLSLSARTDARLCEWRFLRFRAHHGDDEPEVQTKMRVVQADDGGWRVAEQQLLDGYWRLLLLALPMQLACADEARAVRVLIIRIDM